jgi:hypothetical protein
LTPAGAGNRASVEPLEQHVDEVSKGRRWWTPFAVQGWVTIAVAFVAAVIIAAVTIAYVLA